MRAPDSLDASQDAPDDAAVVVERVSARPLVSQRHPRLPAVSSGPLVPVARMGLTTRFAGHVASPFPAPSLVHVSAPPVPGPIELILIPSTNGGCAFTTSCTT
jgi:hypothetical protein